MIPGLRIIELVLEIVLEAMKGQPPEIKAELWKIYLRDIEWWRRVLKLDEDAVKK